MVAISTAPSVSVIQYWEPGCSHPLWFSTAQMHYGCYSPADNTSIALVSLCPMQLVPAHTSPFSHQSMFCLHNPYYLGEIEGRAWGLVSSLAISWGFATGMKRRPKVGPQGSMVVTLALSGTAGTLELMTCPKQGHLCQVSI